MKIDRAKLTQNIVTWLAIGGLGLVLASAQTVRNNSKLGKDAHEQLKQTNERVDSLYCKEHKQDVINAVVRQQVDELSEDMKDVKRMVEQIYINVLEK